MKYQTPIYKPQVSCPSCGELKAIDYCKFDTKYIWWCDNNNCGKQYSFTIGSDWSVKAEPTGTVVKKTKVTLKVKKQTDDIFIVLEGTEFDGEHNDRYFYEEHTCPSNLIRDGIEVYLGDIPDPHEIFEYVKTEPLDEE